jgi:hypothetical protein
MARTQPGIDSIVLITQQQNTRIKRLIMISLFCSYVEDPLKEKRFVVKV